MKGPLPSQALKLAATMSLLGIWFMRIQGTGLCRHARPILSHRLPLFKFSVCLDTYLLLNEYTHTNI